MNAISRYLTEDHEVCDGLFADSENAVCAADWCQAQTHCKRFVQSTLRHFAREREPLPLYPILKQLGYRHQAHLLVNGDYEILIEQD